MYATGAILILVIIGIGFGIKAILDSSNGDERKVGNHSLFNVRQEIKDKIQCRLVFAMES